MRAMRMYPALLRAYWQRALVYRSAYVIWIVNAAFPLVMMSIWIALAQDGPIGGYDATDFAAYYLAAILARRITGCNIVLDLENLIRTGGLSAHMLRPVNLIHHFIAQVVTARSLNLPVVALPIAIIVLLLPGQQFNLSAPSLIMFVLACLVGFAFEFLSQYVIGGLSFWVTQAHGINAVFVLAKSLLGGYIVPLALFPPDMQAVLRLLPFQSSVALPVEILTGRITLEAALSGLFVSAVWVVLIGLAGRLVWRAGLRLYSAVGA